MRRKKANFSDIIDNDVIYTNFGQLTDRKTGNTGEFFHLEKPLSAEQSDFFSQFKNVSFTTAQYRYAPEIQDIVMILWDKCL